MVNHMHHFENEIPIMVTFKGSIILEMGCSGINIVSISSRFPCDCPIIPNSLEDYRKILNGEIELNKIYLNDNQINNYLKQKNKIINALERIQQIK